MTIATGNRLLPVLAAGVLLMLVFVTLKSCSGEDDEQLVMETVPRAPIPDADTPADTIKTLTANVAAMTTEVKALRRDNS
ncbi:MAG: TIGR03752 family integrating conjugative element protein, partial [Rhodobacteraceae bacterium]|nr:TIGR03752 family integrating conjugative element protein [Paracoccaceae bacterium]